MMRPSGRSGGIVSWRLGLVVGFLVSSTLALVGRLGYLQLVEHSEYRQRAKAEHWSRQTVFGHRGAILDTNGHPLAVTVALYKVFIEPDPQITLEEATAAAQALAPQLGLSMEQVMAAYSGQEEVLLKGDVPYDKGIEISRWGLPGVRLEKVFARAYPEGNLAAALLGFVGRDQKGLAGLEVDFHRELGGVPGSLIFERDSLGNPIPLGYLSLVPPREGADLILTIDRYIQRLVERELDEAVKKHDASGGTIIVMEPRTGAILAMASRPSFDLTKLVGDGTMMDLYRNRAITDMYEPGSVLKLITMAAALDEGLITPQTTFYDGGTVVRYGTAISNWDGRANGVETMTEVLKRSANVGAVWVSDLLGQERYYKYVKRFGFGQPTNVGLAGESAGQVRTPEDEAWSPIDLNTNSFGQGINVTPLQLITAVSAIANGGKLMQPYVVKALEGKDYTRVFRPVEVRGVISEETARQLTQMMNEAAERGETKLAIVPGYHIAGKTGTASIATEKGYTTGATIGSFVGFAPMENPRFVILVKIDEPKDTPWGSLVASPVFSSLARQILNYMGVPPGDLAVAQP